jgi:hypothetical protein
VSKKITALSAVGFSVPGLESRARQKKIKQFSESIANGLKPAFFYARIGLQSCLSAN